MKKLLVLVAVLVLSLMLALPAMATVDVYADIDKTKTKTVVEVIDIYKDIDLIIEQDVKVDKSAESEIIKNQLNEDNYVCEDCSEKYSLINGSAFSGSTGIVNVNQASGNMNNQGNEVSIAIDMTRGTGFAHSEVAVEQINQNNEVNSKNIAWRKNEILDSAFSDVTGVLSVNQTAGHMNNQNNSTSMAISSSAVAALSEADLGQLTTLNTVTETAVNNNYDLMAGSAFTGFLGIANVNQSSGNMVNQANIVSIAAMP